MVLPWIHLGHFERETAGKWAGRGMVGTRMERGTERKRDWEAERGNGLVTQLTAVEVWRSQTKCSCERCSSPRCSHLLHW